MSGDSREIVTALHAVLNQLVAHPCPHVPNPPGCKKRASVAVVLRVRPAYTPVPETAPESSVVDIAPPEKKEDEPPSTIDDFFAQPWVRDGGDLEVLFIKRAGRAGDRWSGHVALPGGKRDPADASDMAAAVRETREEVGLDLSAPRCLPAGNLPERVVATTWGREALMVLCPFVFLYTCRDADVPRVRPQPTEVAAAHWVPLRALLAPGLRTREYVDTSGRMAPRWGGRLAQALLRLTVGRMVFSAIRLAPSESVFASSIPGFVPDADAGGESPLEGFLEGVLGLAPAVKREGRQQLLLWGLTLGVLADFLDLLPPHNAVKLWRYPTFTVPDLRLLVWLMTRGLRRGNAGDFSAGTWPSASGHPVAQTAVDAGTEAVAVDEPTKLENEVGISGLGVGRHPQDVVSRLLSGYYERINLAVAVFVLYRTVVSSAAAYWLYKLWMRRRAAAR